VPDTLRHGSPTVIFESYPVPGYNYRLTDVQAAIGRQQLKRLPDIVASRRALAISYAELLAEIDGVLPPREPAWARSNWQSYCVRLDFDLDQHSIMQAMLDRGVATRRGIMCIHLEGAYAGEPRRFSLLRSEMARDHAILLPLFAQMTYDMQAEVVAALVDAIAVGRPLQSATA
jgi:dTDP-4-amino-4,6-dideoxygalactose transaminase